MQIVFRTTSTFLSLVKLRSIIHLYGTNASRFTEKTMLIFRTMKYQYERFDLRMNSQEREALEKLAEMDSVTMSKWVKNRIRQYAKRKKVWI